MADRERFLVYCRIVDACAEHHGTAYGRGLSSTVLQNAAFESFYQHLREHGLDAATSYNDPCVHPRSFFFRTRWCEPLCVHFDTRDDLRVFQNALYCIPGVHQVLCVRGAHSNWVIQTFFDVLVLQVDYVYNYALSSERAVEDAPCHLRLDVHATVSRDIEGVPCLLYQDLDVHAVHCTAQGLLGPEASTLFLQQASVFCHLEARWNGHATWARETKSMRNLLRYTVEQNVVPDALQKCLQFRSSAVLHLLQYLQLYTVPNSPIQLHTDPGSTCLICYEPKAHLYRWVQQLPGGYCDQCLKLYVQHLVQASAEHDVDIHDKHHFHVEPVLSMHHWEGLTEKQIYLIENVLVCPVGNKADFSLVQDARL